MKLFAGKDFDRSLFFGFLCTGHLNPFITIGNIDGSSVTLMIVDCRTKFPSHYPFTWNYKVQAR